MSFPDEDDVGMRKAGGIRPSSQRPRIILIHGAAHGSWCWEKITPLLTDAGYDVLAPDLPGLGDDPADPASVTFADYVARVVDTLCSDDRPAVLVGHSMGGGPISAAAEEVPKRVARLVYVAAVLPMSGETMATAFQGEKPAGLPPMRQGAVAALQEFDPDDARDLFYGCCSRADADAAIRRLRAQTLAPATEPIHLTAERWGTIPKSYILCLRDGILPPDTQRWLCARSDGIRVHMLDTDHSPFLSTPEELAALLIDEADAVRT